MDSNYSPAEEAMAIELKNQWLGHPVTAKVFKEIRTEINSLEESARNLAVGYHVTQNHLSIVQQLVRADTLRKILETYGRQKD